MTTSMMLKKRRHQREQQTIVVVIIKSHEYFLIIIIIFGSAGWGGLGWGGLRWGVVALGGLLVSRPSHDFTSQSNNEIQMIPDFPFFAAALGLARPVPGALLMNPT